MSTSNPEDWEYRWADDGGHIWPYDERDEEVGAPLEEILELAEDPWLYETYNEEDIWVERRTKTVAAGAWEPCGARAEANRRWPHSGLGEARFTAGVQWLAEYLLSDENVERAAQGILSWSSRKPLAEWPKDIQEGLREQARAALSAVVGDREKERTKQWKTS